MGTTIAFRVDAGGIHGWGHLMRCTALARELQHLGARIVWICRTTSHAIQKHIRRQDYTVLALSRLPQRGSPPPRATWLDVSWETDAAETLDALERAGIVPDWLIVDHYGIDRAWEEHVSTFVPKVFVIDDIPGRQHRCDLLLDQTAPSRSQAAPGDGHALRGPAYALIRESFRALRSKALMRRQAGEAGLQRILISFGATDHLNMTSVALEAVAQSGFAGVVDVVVGAEAAQQREVDRRAKGMEAEVRVHNQVDDMAPLMLHADLAIGACGMTAWERCVLGLPTLMVSTAENQLMAVHTLQEAGAAHYLGHAEALQAQTLAERIDHFTRNSDELAEMSLQAARLCDGLGAPRVALHLIPPRGRDGIPVTLRPARASDCDMVYAWQSLPETRRYARNPDIPQYADHQRWFAARLHDLGCILHIVEYGGCPVGVVRLDFVREPSTYEVSIFIDPAAHQRGIASAALTGVHRLMRTSVLHAFVLPENTASRRLFEKMGYVYHADQEMFIFDPSAKGSEAP